MRSVFSGDVYHVGRGPSTADTSLELNPETPTRLRTLYPVRHTKKEKKEHIPDYPRSCSLSRASAHACGISAFVDAFLARMTDFNSRKTAAESHAGPPPPAMLFAGAGDGNDRDVTA